MSLHGKKDLIVGIANRNILSEPLRENPSATAHQLTLKPSGDQAEL